MEVAERHQAAVQAALDGLAAAGLDGGRGGGAGVVRVAGEHVGAVVGQRDDRAAQAEKARLQAEVAEMQANRDEWVKAGFLAKLERCGRGVTLRARR